MTPMFVHRRMSSDHALSCGQYKLLYYGRSIGNLYLCAKFSVMCRYLADWCSHHFLKTKSLVGLGRLAEPKFGFWHLLPNVCNSSSKKSKPSLCHSGPQANTWYKYVHTGKILIHVKHINLKTNKEKSQTASR